MKSNLITEEEKNRILNMHKKRSANHYLVEQSGNNPTPKKPSLPEPFIHILDKYRFTKTSRFQMLNGVDGVKGGPYSPDGSICYKGGTCQVSDPKNPWKAYNVVHLEFDLKPSSTTAYVHVIIEDKDNKKVTKVVGSYRLTISLDQKGADKLLQSLYGTNIGFGC